MCHLPSVFPGFQVYGVRRGFNRSDEVKFGNGRVSICGNEAYEYHLIFAYSNVCSQACFIRYCAALLLNRGIP